MMFAWMIGFFVVGILLVGGSIAAIILRTGLMQGSAPAPLLLRSLYGRRSRFAEVCCRGQGLADARVSKSEFSVLNGGDHVQTRTFVH